jgi:hypothetical protein
MEVVNLLFFLYILIGMPALGAYAVLFNRRFAIGSLEWRRRVFKMGYADWEVRFGRVLAVMVGTLLFIAGLMNAAMYLHP